MTLGNVGNIDLVADRGTVTLRMRHLVQGHPGAVLTHAEVRTLIAKLESAISNVTPLTPANLSQDSNSIRDLLD